MPQEGAAMGAAVEAARPHKAAEAAMGAAFVAAEAAVCSLTEHFPSVPFFIPHALRAHLIK